MDLIEKAMIFAAAKAHKNQTRKGTDIPYITHPFAVGLLLQKSTEDIFTLLKTPTL